MTPDFQAVIFDLDGTLLYTLEDLADSLNTVLAEAGLPRRPLADYRFMVGNGLETLTVRALPEDRRRPEDVRPILRKFSALYRERQLIKTRPYPGIEELLADLTGRGLRLAVFSNKAHPNTLSVVEHFFPGMFQAILGLQPGRPPKPDPAGALSLAAQVSLSPGQFIYLGDSGVDMKTAVAAAMFPVGAAWGYRPVDELWAAGAARIISVPGELTGLWP
ncbi:MAG: HAD family hydrolase [Candidatus Adiutrix sp.]|jgi:phosphoglycolate phosphatase|nr:HAD family hydrolase [Candidatus Adiutrix sp.]